MPPNVKGLAMGEPVPPHVADSIFAGNKIEAIKLYREQTGVGLKEAKDRVEAIEIVLRALHPERFASAPRTSGCMGVLLLVAAAILTLSALPV